VTPDTSHALPASGNWDAPGRLEHICLPSPSPTSLVPRSSRHASRGGGGGGARGGRGGPPPRDRYVTAAGNRRRRGGGSYAESLATTVPIICVAARPERSDRVRRDARPPCCAVTEPVTRGSRQPACRAAGPMHL
jgi:hypothetical protein